MQFALYAWTTGIFADPRLLAALARQAEEAGWDGFFLMDALEFEGQPNVDTWITLAAIAAVTQRIRLGPMVTPLPQRRPWKVAREVVTLDHLAGGRLILGLGLGDAPEADLARFGAVTDLRVRGAMVDEALEVIAGLLSGRTFAYTGRHYRVGETTFLPQPLQPRVPIWIGASDPLVKRAALRRAARFDGVFPIGLDRPPDEVRVIANYIRARRDPEVPFDIAIPAAFPPRDAANHAARIAAYAAAGATWLVGGIGPWFDTVEEARQMVRSGPPRS